MAEVYGIPHLSSNAAHTAKKVRLSFRPTAPYSEERRRAASEAAKAPRAISSEVWYNFFEKSFGFDVVFAAKTVVYR